MKNIILFCVLLSFCYADSNSLDLSSQESPKNVEIKKLKLSVDKIKMELMDNPKFIEKFKKIPIENQQNLYKFMFSAESFSSSKLNTVKTSIKMVIDINDPDDYVEPSRTVAVKKVLKDANMTIYDVNLTQNKIEIKHHAKK